MSANWDLLWEAVVNTGQFHVVEPDPDKPDIVYIRDMTSTTFCVSAKWKDGNWYVEGTSHLLTDVLHAVATLEVTDVRA